MTSDVGSDGDVSKPALGIDRCYAPDEIVINFSDAVLYGRDLALLESGTAWLNDACLHYGFLFLLERYGESNADAAVVDPSVVSFLVNQVDDDDEFLEFWHGLHQGDQPVGTACKRYFIPVNDSFGDGRVRWRSGQHWSLLVVVVSNSTEGRTETSAFHFDSLGRASSNLGAASVVLLKFMKAMKIASAVQSKQSQSQLSTSGFVPKKGASIQHVTVVRQLNGYDCGVMVLTTVEALLASSFRPLCDGSDEAVKQDLIDAITRFFTSSVENASPSRAPSRDSSSDPGSADQCGMESDLATETAERVCLSMRRKLALDARSRALKNTAKRPNLVV
jgi:Ulp1 protease family, C-terminal catalytic domain